MSDADDPSESSSDDNLEHDYEITEDKGQNDSSDNSYSDVSDEECVTEMDAPETSISQDIHTINDREINLDPDDDGSLPDLNDHGLDLSNNNISNATTENEIIQSRLLIVQYHHRFQLGMVKDSFHPLQVVALCGSTGDF